MIRATERPNIPREHPDAYWDPYKQFTGSRVTPLNTTWHIHITSPQQTSRPIYGAAFWATGRPGNNVAGGTGP